MEVLEVFNAEAYGLKLPAGMQLHHGVLNVIAETFLGGWLETNSIVSKSQNL